MHGFRPADGQTGPMSSASRDESRRQRLREYDAEVAAARPALAVLMQFVQGREARESLGLLEESFADTHVTDAAALPASVWVTLRQGDLDATVETLIRLSDKQFAIGEREELDASYRLTTIEEHRPLPDLQLLQHQLAEFLRIPVDVVTAITGWGPDDPRTTAEVDSLLQQRFGAVALAAPAGPSAAPAGQAAPVGADPTPEPMPATRTAVAPAPLEPVAGLLMSSNEFSALLHLTPEQADSLQTLVRQTRITISRD